jgi:phosphatidylcholine synthase
MSGRAVTTRAARATAWAVHLYTVTGLALGAAAAVLIVDGGAASLRLALLLLLVATAIDATDGVLARRFDAASVLPRFDGRRLDDIVDFHCYVSLPLLLIWRAGLLPGAAGWLLLGPLVAAAYGFSQTEAKTEDGYFLGFPSYWNVVALYLFLLHPAPATTAFVVTALAVLTFVPARYLYPSMAGRLNRIAALGGAAWGVALLAILLHEAAPRTWVLLSLAYPAWYMAASWWVTLRRHRREA